MISTKISPALLQRVGTLSDEKLEVIAYAKNPLRLSRFDITHEFPFMGAVAIKIGQHELEGLAECPQVEYISEDGQVFALDDDTCNAPLPAGGLSTKSRLTGKGVTLCILDTGLSHHLDFCLPVNRIKEFKDILSNRESPYDDNGHGTFVTGVAAGGGVTSGGRYLGAAPAAQIVSVKVIGKKGEGGALHVLEGMQWLADNARRLDISVCCMSFGSTPTDINDPLKRGAEALVRYGITVVAASGNSGVGQLKSPAISPEVIGVGAVNKFGDVAPFTSRGYVGGRQKPELYADGVDVISVAAGASYGKMSGTSVAAPYVAGACCLLLERFPRATPRRIRDMLLMSARPNKYGFHILRID